MKRKEEIFFKDWIWVFKKLHDERSAHDLFSLCQVFGGIRRGLTANDLLEEASWMIQKLLRKGHIKDLRVEAATTYWGENFKNQSFIFSPSFADLFPKTDSSKIFLVHGHDEGFRNEVELFLHELKITPIILCNQANGGSPTIIEKFEDHSNVGFAIVLMTPDDICQPKLDPEKKENRARQNVVFELGFFLAKLNRQNVFIIKKGDLEVPSDINGVLDIRDMNNWRWELQKELKAAGLCNDQPRNILKPLIGNLHGMARPSI